MKKTLLVFPLSLLLLLTNLHAQQTEVPVFVPATSPVSAKLLIEAGIEYGGDEILRVFFTNGDDQVMRAGQGLLLGVGGQLKFSAVKNLLLRASIGFKYNTTAADNANIMLTRLPVTVMPFWEIRETFRVGVGLTSHMNVRFKGDGFVPDVAYTSSIGPRVEVGYKWIALTYTALTYKNAQNEGFSASSLGACLSFTLPDR